MAVFSVPGSERIIISRDSVKANLSNIILKVDNTIEIEVLKKPNHREYEICINIANFGFGKYDDGRVFYRRKEAFDERDKILTEMRKGERGEYKITYKGKGEISLHLTPVSD